MKRLVKQLSGIGAAQNGSRKKALQNINNSFSEIRLAYRDYARYCLKSGNKTESARAIDIMKELNPDHPETVQLAKRLQGL